MKWFIFSLSTFISALALPHSVMAGSTLPITTASIAGNPTMAPIGWLGFCKKYPADCNVPTLKPERITLTEATWNLLVVVNANVNEAVEPTSDMAHWGVNESWDYPDDKKGDCEDYALQKRRLLIKAGIPRQALPITIVFDKRGDGHAVLMAETDHGDFVLDNQARLITAWDHTGYTFLRRMSDENPNVWVSMKEGAADVTVAAR